VKRLPDPTPRLVVERFLDLVDAGAWHMLAELYACDALVELPFAQPMPIRLDGRDAIRAHFARVAGRMRLRVIDRHLLDTADPEVIVADYRYDGGVLSSGKRLVVSNIQIFRVRGGVIITSRDFHDHAALRAGLAPAMADAKRGSDEPCLATIPHFHLDDAR
jgi:ketosteroid isomerase-like protein